MDFLAAGVFEIGRQKNGHVDISSGSKALFWRTVEDESPGLSRAAGCYVFVLFNGRSAMPWYVGKAERQSFETEIFALHKVHHYNEVLASNKGTPYVFLLPRVTARRKLCKPTRAENSSIKLLEILLIGMALRRNPQLRNIRDVALLRKLRIEGVLNSKVRGRPSSASAHLRRALRVS
jgi:hypothetical protein